MYKFNGKIEKILDMVIHNVYSEKDSFLRELISNSSDACEKLRYEIIKNHLDINTNDLRIEVAVDAKKKQIIITDNGIGMSKDELVKNLGTIAHSGTEEFVNEDTEESTNVEEKNQNSSEDFTDKDDSGHKASNDLIGRFGIGFYASFIVAKNVTVSSKKYNEDIAYKWKSDGIAGFTVVQDKEFHERGTKIVLDIKEDMLEYIDRYKIKNIIKVYSNSISTPIDVEEEEGVVKRINDSVAIWSRPKSSLNEDDYNSFFKSISYSPSNPAITMHSVVDGVVNFKSLLFVPADQQFELFHPDRATKVKLYLKKVFVSDKIEIIPKYLRFVNGVVDVDDLDITISRESLKDDRRINKIKNILTKKIITELKSKLQNDKETYDKIWSNFGQVIKEGLCESTVDRQSLLDLCKFDTSKNSNISFEDYINNMSDSQKKEKKIFFCTCSSKADAQYLPSMEYFIKNDIEVIFLADHVDTFWITNVNEVNGYNLESIQVYHGSKDKKNESSSDASEDISVEDKDLIDFVKDTLGSEEVSEIKFSDRLQDSPACRSIEGGKLDMKLENFLLEQNQLKHKTAKILELNPDHKIIKYIKKEFMNGKREELKDLIICINDLCKISNSEKVENASKLSKTLVKYVGLSCNEA